MARRAAVMVVAGCVALLSACSSSHANNAADTSTASSSTTASTTVVPTTTTTAPTGPTSAAELESKLSNVVPPGFRVQPDSVDDTGPSDLAKAARDEGSEDGGAVLRGEHFVRGYQRLWVDGAKHRLALVVYQFENQAGATENFNRGADLLRATAFGHAFPFPLNGFATGSTLALVAKVPGEYAVVAMTHRGPFVIQIRLGGAKPEPLEAAVAAMLTDQATRLGVTSDDSRPPGSD